MIAMVITLETIVWKKKDNCFLQSMYHCIIMRIMPGVRNEFLEDQSREGILTKTIYMFDLFVFNL